MAKRPLRNPETALSSAWKAVWNTPEGRLAISELLLATNVYSEIMATDPVQLALAVGERNMGARIARLIELKPEAYAQDAREAVDLVGRFIDATDQDWKL